MSKRHNRTRALILAPIVVSLAVLFYRHDTDSRPRHTSRQQSSVPQKGGTLVFATEREPLCLDPHVYGDMPQVYIAEQYLDRLVSMDEQGAIYPWLATSWEITDGGLTYIFHLRHDVTFTDGTRFDAAAVKRNLDHMVDPTTQSGTAGGYIRQYTRTDILDPYTAAVHLSSPYSAFLNVLAQGFLGIESPTALARPRDVNCQSPVGSGPFIISHWDHQSEVVLKRNPAYAWAPPTALHQGPAWLEGIVWRFVSEPSVRFAMLQAGEVGVIDSVPPEGETPAKANPDVSLLMADRPGNPTNGTLNTLRPPFNDIRVREAFIRSADIDGALASIFFHHYARAGGPLSPSTPDYSPDFEHTKNYDPRRANTLLDDAGWKKRDPDGYRIRDGKRLIVHIPISTVLAPADRTLWEQVQATARQTGFDVRLEPLSETANIARSDAWDYDVRIGYWNTNTPDVLRIVFGSAFTNHFRHGIHQNASGYSNPLFDGVVEQALATQDQQQRKAFYQHAQEIVAKAQLQITTYSQTTRLGVFSNVHGVRIEPSLRVINFHDAWMTP
ncbi:ABC transporter substrate-binding protein [Gluconobacter cerinus]|uniref:ABC transporter substrate-binding protein n=1 Tax=Gluconobacter cerinus TaxID=38307 RepID=UPI0020112945|nr:ABC transporter substrate-binding protein [Gluconobacter cerinus]